jgi:hypothetical protein
MRWLQHTTYGCCKNGVGVDERADERTDGIRPDAGASACQPWHKPRWRPPSRQRSSTSSPTTYATSMRRSKCVVSSPNRGFIARESTSSLVSHSTPRNPTSTCGRRRFRMLPPLPLTTRAVSPFVAFHPSPPWTWMRVVGSVPFTTSSIYTWRPLTRKIINPLSPYSTDYRPPSDHSV